VFNFFGKMASQVESETEGADEGDRSLKAKL
jgi:hypothetical protein